MFTDEPCTFGVKTTPELSTNRLCFVIKAATSDWLVTYARSCGILVMRVKEKCRIRTSSNSDSVLSLGTRGKTRRLPSITAHVYSGRRTTSQVRSLPTLQSSSSNVRSASSFVCADFSKPRGSRVFADRTRKASSSVTFCRWIGPIFWESEAHCETTGRAKPVTNSIMPKSAGRILIFFSC
jgi:hypothetical protein